MFERFTQNAREALFFSRVIAAERRHGAIEGVDLLRALILVPHDQFSDAVRDALKVPEVLESDRRPNETFETLLDRIEETDWFRETTREIPFSTSVKRVLENAAVEADALDHRDIRAEHLLLGLLREEETEAWRTLNAVGVTLKEVRRALTRKG